MKFGDDWTGFFIRGDNALHFAHALGRVFQFLKEHPEVNESAARLMDAYVVRGLAHRLQEAKEGARPETTIQTMKPFEDCTMGNE